MLILTRKRNESIKIGNDILIKVVQTKSGLVKLGIEAPSDVRVLRGELMEFSAAPGLSMGHGSEVDHARPSNIAISMEGDSDFNLSTEYAAEVEDQMLCVATD